MRRMGLGLALTVLLGLSAAGAGWAQDSRTLLAGLLANERSASADRGHYEYMNEERSDRTGGRLWTEKVAETESGRVRLLVAEDGKPLSAGRMAEEKARLARDAEHPEEFERREAEQKADEEHARKMLAIWPETFLFDAPVVEGEYLRIRYRPNPQYQPQTMEERVVHAMHGSVVVDPKRMRLREMDGRMNEDVGLGFGPFAVVKAGSNFSTRREHVDGPDWKMESLHVDIAGRAFFFKTLAKKQDIKRWGYRRIADGLSVAQAVAMLEQ